MGLVTGVFRNLSFSMESHVPTIELFWDKILTHVKHMLPHVFYENYNARGDYGNCFQD